MGGGDISVPDSSVAFAVPKDTVLNNTADPARSIYMRSHRRGTG